MDRQTFEINLSNLSENKAQLYREYLLSKLREDIYIFLLSRKSEDEYYDFFNKSDIEKDLICDVICVDLENAGLKYKVGYGNTALFIFKTLVPKTCWG